ncbi:hypothetical protein [Chamaesiphon sp.]|uniref:hypothetical protein n=1 Tax=Chamaesiphon sp. TaxID=2814140 RepID=UPI00359488BB
MIRRDNWLIAACQNKKVLPIGCTDSPITAEKIANRELLHFKLAEAADDIIGLDIDREGIDELPKLVPHHTFLLHSTQHTHQSFSDPLGDIFVGSVAPVEKNVSPYLHPLPLLIRLNYHFYSVCLAVI